MPREDGAIPVPGMTGVFKRAVAGCGGERIAVTVDDAKRTTCQDRARRMPHRQPPQAGRVRQVPAPPAWPAGGISGQAPRRIDTGPPCRRVGVAQQRVHRHVDEFSDRRNRHAGRRRRASGPSINVWI